MKVLGKLFVFISGLIIGLFLSYMTLGIVLSDDSILTIVMAAIVLFYWISWLLVLIKTKLRLYLIALTMFIGFIIFSGYLELLFSEFSELTLMVGFMALAYVGLFMLNKSNKKLHLDFHNLVRKEG